MRASLRTCVFVAATGLLSASLWASPAFLITSPPVVKGTIPGTGPLIDPLATMGQWFRTVTPGTISTLENRAWEFHDNITGSGGGTPDHLAIEGRVTGVNINAGLVTGYIVTATIRNNTPNVSGSPRRLANLHEEDVLQDTLYVGPMLNVKLAIHWADDGIIGNFNVGGPNRPGLPATPTGESNTFAVGYDELAWYSYTPGQTLPTGGPVIPGDYVVPTWDFGNIPVGGAVTRDLVFGLYTAISSTAFPTPTSQDILIARSTDLKIGQYFQVDPVLNGVVDNGSPYPNGAPNSVYGNASVFFAIPEPAALSLLMPLPLLLRRRR
jgi:hypothetical protein